MTIEHWLTAGVVAVPPERPQSVPAFTTARVRVVVEVPIANSWSDTVTMAQLRDQAAEAALCRLHAALGGADILVLGEPAVIAIHHPIAR